MIRVSETAEHWSGLCRKPPVFRALQADIVNLPQTAREGSPDGGAGGPETIRRGIGAALSGTKTLIHNPQLLGFSLLAGLVLAVHLIAWAWLYVSPEWLFFKDTNSVLAPLVLTSVAGLLAVFCLVFLLAGLALSLSSKKDDPVSFFQGLNRAKKYLIPLTGGSVVAALAGILLFVQPFIARGELFVRNPRWLLSGDLHYGGLPSLLVQTFVIELLTVFCLVFLLAGLALSLSSKKGDPVSFFQGLSRAKKYGRPLTGWSVVVALAGTLIYIAGMYPNLPAWFSPFNIVSALYFKLGYFLFMVRYQFPFNFVLTPTLYIPNLPPVFGGDGWLISWALECTLVLSAIMVSLFLLTVFVVPLIVLEGQSLKEAVLGSFTLMKNTWGEVAACVLCLGMVVFAASLAWRFAGQMYTSFTTPLEPWIAAGLLYVFALICFAFVVATVGGIAVLDLYTSAKTGQMLRSAETKPPA